MTGVLSRMKTPSQRRCPTIRQIVVGINLLVFCTGFLMAASAETDVVVNGSKLPWTARIPSGWVGGTAEKIEQILANGESDSASRTLDVLLRQLLPESKHLDVFFCHLDLTGIETQTLSSLRVNVLALNLEPFADATNRKDLWNAFAKQWEKDFPEGATVEMMNDRAGMTGGRKAYEATFVATLPGGGKVYKVLHLVVYAPGKTHIFQLVADSRKFRARFAEFEKILASLNYSSEPTSTTLAGPSDEVKKLAESLRGNKDALMKLKPTAGQIAQIAANDEDAKELSAYVERVFADVPAEGINAKPGQSEILVMSGVMPADLDSLPGGYAQQAAHFRKGVAIYGFEYVAPGETAGIQVDGLVKLASGWVMIPGAWSAFEK
jgi:hypothetical protein